MLWEDELVYALNCPVKVESLGTAVDGTIVCPKPGKGDRELSYTVQYLLKGNSVKIELGVDPEQISFRQVLTLEKEKAERPSTTTKQTQETKQDETQKAGDNGTENGGNSLSQSESQNGGIEKPSDTPIAGASLLVPNSRSMINGTEGGDKHNNTKPNQDDTFSINKTSAASAAKPDSQNPVLKHNGHNHSGVSISSLQSSAIPVSQASANMPTQKQPFDRIQSPTVKRSNSASMPNTTSTLSHTMNRSNTMANTTSSTNNPGGRWEPPRDSYPTAATTHKQGEVKASPSIGGTPAHEPLPKGTWEDANDGSSTLTVPMWVTDSTKNLFCEFFVR